MPYNNLEKALNTALQKDKEGKYEEAIQHYSDALSIDPNQPQALLNRGLCYNDLKQHEAALNDLDKLVKVEPSVSAYCNRSAVLFAMKKYDDAEADLHTSLKLDPASAQVHFNLGILHKRKKDYTAAIKSFVRVIDIDPNYSDTRALLADTLKYAKNVLINLEEAEQKQLFSLLKGLDKKVVIQFLGSELESKFEMTVNPEASLLGVREAGKIMPSLKKFHELLKKLDPSWTPSIPKDDESLLGKSFTFISTISEQNKAAKMKETTPVNAPVHVFK